MTKIKRKGICCFCGEKYKDWGNNPQPIIEDGRCCDRCNWYVVLPARVREYEAAKAAAH
jgi:hypothetical protein